MTRTLSDSTIGIIGLGYVGLPLAVEFGKKYRTIGFDAKQTRVDELKAGHDRTREVEPGELAQAGLLTCTTDPEKLRACNVFIVSVPTPVDHANRPDLTPLVKASETVGKVMSAGAVVIYESTVPRRHGRGLRAAAGAALGAEVRLLRQRFPFAAVGRNVPSPR